MIHYTPLPLGDPDRSIDLPGSPALNAPFLALDAPALEAMTDFRRMPAISVLATTQIDIALERMIFSGVRLLFVVDVKLSLLGSISSYDIQNEKPMLYLQSLDCRIATCSRADVAVRDIMEPVSKWQVLNYEDLGGANIGNLVQTLKDQARRHIIVVETPRGGAPVVRGMISASFLERALGTTIQTADSARSFAEIERALVR